MSAFGILLRCVAEQFVRFRQSKFGWNLAGGSIEISDFGADVNNRATLKYSVFTKQVQLGQSTISGGSTYITYITYITYRYIFYLLFLFPPFI